MQRVGAINTGIVKCQLYSSDSKSHILFTILCGKNSCCFTGGNNISLTKQGPHLTLFYNSQSSAKGMEVNDHIFMQDSVVHFMYST